jgi:hypothetical protein
MKSKRQNGQGKKNSLVVYEKSSEAIAPMLATKDSHRLAKEGNLQARTVKKKKTGSGRTPADSEVVDKHTTTSTSS